MASPSLTPAAERLMRWHLKELTALLARMDEKDHAYATIKARIEEARRGLGLTSSE